MMRGVTNTHNVRVKSVRSLIVYMGHYLLTVEEHAGENLFYTNHVIEAEDEQKVKYHYHRTMKDGAYTDSSYNNKHLLESFDLGLMTDIYEIKEISEAEFSLLEHYIPTWVKI